MSQRMRHSFQEHERGWVFAATCGCVQCNQHREWLVFCAENRVAIRDLHLPSWVLAMTIAVMLLHEGGIL